MTTGQVRRALRQYQRWMEILHELQGQSAEVVARLMSEYAETLARIVAAGTHSGPVAVTDDAQRLAMLNRIEGQLQQMVTNMGAAFGATASRLGEGIGRQFLDTYGVFGKPTLGRLVAAQEAFSRDGVVIGSEGYQSWITKFQNDAVGLRDIMRRELVRAQILGSSQGELANALLTHPEFNFENLPPVTDRGMALFTRGGSLGESKALANRARLIARTELQAVTVDLQIAWTQRAGFKRYVNVNPLDERTTDGCREASQQPPMTLEEWRAWRGSDGQGGIPIRRPHCRSALLAVPNTAVPAARELAITGQIR